MRRLFPVIVIACLALSGYEGRGKEKVYEFIPGTYGVSENNSQVVLTLGSDGTYCYLDNTLKTPQRSEGTWTRAGNVIVLKVTGEKKLHDHWKIEQSTPCIKARKGLEWRRLCLVKSE